MMINKTPHKGDASGSRRAWFPRSRITKRTRQRIEEIMAARGMSAADWATRAIDDEYDGIVRCPHCHFPLDEKLVDDGGTLGIWVCAECAEGNGKIVVDT